MYNEEQDIPYGKLAALGFGGLAATAIAGRAFAPHQSSIIDWAQKQNYGWASSDLAKKFAGNENLVGGFKKWSMNYDKFDSGLGGRAFGGGRTGAMRQATGAPLFGEAKMYAPRRRMVNSIDKRLYGSKLTRSSLWKAPLTAGVGLMLINSEVEENGYSGFVTGAARELGGQVFGSLGMGIGSTLGHAISGGAAFGGPIGLAAGALIGGIGGASIVDGIKSMSRIGKQWSLPDLGGSYKDSQGAQTMRQRSLNAIRTSQFNIRSELGNEALRISGL